MAVPQQPVTDTKTAVSQPASMSPEVRKVLALVIRAMTKHQITYLYDLRKHFDEVAHGMGKNAPTRAEFDAVLPEPASTSDSGTGFDGNMLLPAIGPRFGRPLRFDA